MNILIFGANGQVGWELQRSLSTIGPIAALDRRFIDLQDLIGLRRVIQEQQPDVIVNAAAYTAVDKAEKDYDKAKLINADAVKVMAEEADRLSAWLFHYSTDYVFDGSSASPYSENDLTNPLSVYGKTKWLGEEAVRSHAVKHVILRTSWVYSARGENFVKVMLDLATSRDELNVVADQYGAPTHAELIADATANILRCCLCKSDAYDLSGTYHLTADGKTNWFNYARLVLEAAEDLGVALKVKPSEIKPISSKEYQVAAIRPKNSTLDCKKIQRTFGIFLPSWRYHIYRTVKELVEKGMINE